MERTNRLADCDSPYLRQHRLDPVDWYPYGPEAFGLAHEEDRPLFLSIGYSACHWCHVMAHESFSDPATAELMNRIAVSVKVDREERPDVDAFYMEAVTATTGSGGWPMSIFATPDGRPFFAGTYFPPSSRHGMPSFRQVLLAVGKAWDERRDEIELQADRLVAALEGRLDPLGFSAAVDPAPEGTGGTEPAAVRRARDAAVARLHEIADAVHGGFGGAPKFPQPLLLDLLLRAAADEEDPARSDSFGIVREALEAMDSGGIYDHVGGGFHRYSVDGGWVVPHFEKMLYDQVLLSRVHLHAWQLSGDPRWRQVMDETLGYVLSRLRRDDGGLYASEDADSEGEEGTYYLWAASDFDAVLPSDLARAAREWYGVTGPGNFESRNVLTLPRRGMLARPPEVEEARRILLGQREKREHPGLDDKVVVEWNAMACSVLAEAAGAAGEDRYRRAAEEIAVILRTARRDSGGTTPRVVVTAGSSRVQGFASDVAWSIDAAVRLYELTGDDAHLTWAQELAEELLSEFLDRLTGVVYTSSATRHEALPVRPVDHADGVTPSAASVAARALGRLGAITSDAALTEAAEAIVERLTGHLASAPTAVPELLWAAELLASGPIEVVATAGAVPLLEGVRRRFIPAAVLIWRRGAEHVALPLLEGRPEQAVYVCEWGACRLPTADASRLEEELDNVLRSRLARSSR